MPKTTLKKATEPGQRLFVDISGPYSKSIGGSEYWLLIVDDFTGKLWSCFLEKKKDIGKALTPILQRLQATNRKTEFLRCDNAGENKAYLTKACDEYGIKMEFTAPHTPKQNGKVERGFVYTRDRALAMMIDARLTEEFQKLFWAEAVSTATALGNALIPVTK